VPVLCRVFILRQPRAVDAPLVIAFLEWGAGQNLFPLLELVRSLNEAGHTCKVCTLEKFRYDQAPAVCVLYATHTCTSDFDGSQQRPRMMHQRQTGGQWKWGGGGVTVTVTTSAVSRLASIARVDGAQAGCGGRTRTVVSARRCILGRSGPLRGQRATGTHSAHFSPATQPSIVRC
jgi:hypothetical protein